MFIVDSEGRGESVAQTFAQELSLEARHELDRLRASGTRSVNLPGSSSFGSTYSFIFIAVVLSIC